MSESEFETPKISFAQITGELVEVGWQDGTNRTFHPIWLRDNCRCESCGDPAIGRRNLRLTSLDLDIRPITLDLVDASLHIQWPDRHESTYPCQWLHEHAYDEQSRQAKKLRPPLWDKLFRDQPPKFDFDTVINSDDGLLLALHKLRDHGLCLIENAPAVAGTLEKLARQIGFPQTSNFGCIQDLVFDRNKASIANDVQALKPHTDEPYRASPPGILLFHCIETDINGAGHSLFMDGFEIAEQLRIEDPEGFDALCSFPQSFRRHFANDVDLISEFPAISVDEFGNINGLRVNDRVAAPLSIPPEVVSIYYRGLKRLLELAEDERRCIKLRLRPGDIAIFDNHRVLHGRTELTINGKRWLQWIQLERGDFHSSLRILADKLGKHRDAKPFLRGSYG